MCRIGEMTCGCRDLKGIHLFLFGVYPQLMPICFNNTLSSKPEWILDTPSAGSMDGQ